MSKKLSSMRSLTELRKYYSGKKVAVAGGAGFVGIQLVRLLSEFVGKDGMVMVLDDFSRGLNVVNEDNVYYAFKAPYDSYVPYELKNSEIARRIVATHYDGVDVADSRMYTYLIEDIDIFFNLAAVVAGVLHNENHHLQMYDDNVRVLAGPLRACEQAGVPAFFQTSSVCVYAEDHQSPCDESEGWGGDPHPANAGYAEAKRDGERAALWSNIDRVVIGRPSNIVGPYDYYDGKAHVIPAFINRSITTDGIFNAYGSPSVQREFIFSWDVALGMAWAMAFGENREDYNIGTNGNNIITMLSLAAKVNQIVAQIFTDKNSNRRILFNNTAGGGDEKRYSNAEKLRALGWSHSIGLHYAIELASYEFAFRGGKWGEPDYLDMYEDFNA